MLMSFFFISFWMISEYNFQKYIFLFSHTVYTLCSKNQIGNLEKLAFKTPNEEIYYFLFFFWVIHSLPICLRRKKSNEKKNMNLRKSVLQKEQNVFHETRVNEFFYTRFSTLNSFLFSKV